MEFKQLDIKKMLQKANKKNLLFLLGILGIALIFLSEFSFQRTDQMPDAAQETSFDSESYTARLQKQLEETIRQIDGAGETRVMVTLESGEQTVYAYAEKTGTDYTQTGEEKVSEKSTYQNDYIMVDDENGNKKALEQTTLEPEVKGVAVVCQGGDDIMVVKRVTELVSVLLGVSTNRICVTKMI